MLISIDKKYATKDGHPVRVICTDYENIEEPHLCVICLIKYKNGESITYRTLSGKTHAEDGWYSEETYDDLVEIE